MIQRNVSPNNDLTVHLALSPWNLSDDYNRHAGVTLISFLENSSYPVTVHLLYDKNLSNGKEIEEQYNKECYQKISEKYNCNILYHNIELPKWINEIPAVKKWTPGTLMRLYLPELLQNVDKVIYLDCDMVVTANMDLLWDTNIDGYYLAACHESDSLFRWDRKRYYNKKNIISNNYFIAGTLIFNLKKIREDDENFTDNIFNYLKDNSDLPFLDQDMLNWYCHGIYYKLPLKYNLYSSQSDALDFSDDCIIHYAASGKPWKRYIGKIDDFYWHYLLKTPWCDTKEKILQYSREAPEISRCYAVIPQNLVIYSAGRVRESLSEVFKLIINIIKELWRGLFYFIKIYLRGKLF